jgi:hypothetical protein
MPVSVFTMTVVSEPGVEPWKVCSTLLKHVEGETYVRLAGSNCRPLIRLLFKGKPPKRMSLSQCKGLSELKRLRNAQAVAESSSAASAFFGAEPAKKKQRVTKEDMENLRSNPTAFQVELPGTDEKVGMLRAAHPSDDVWVHLTETAVDVVFEFIRSFLDLEAEAAPREYNKQEGLSPSRKTWRWGKGRVATMVDGKWSVAPKPSKRPAAADGDSDDGGGESHETAGDGLDELLTGWPDAGEDGILPITEDEFAQ